MSEQKWPDEARDAVEDVLEALDGSDYTVTANAILAALAPHVAPRAGTRLQEWGFDSPAQASLMYVTRNRLLVDTMLAGAPAGTVLMTRVAGPWELAPDA